MTEDQSPDFRFSMDDESPDASLQEDLRDQRLSSLSRRLTVLAIVLPCLIGIVIYLGYMDLKKSLTIQQTSGSQTVQSLSKDLETLFDDLNARLTEIETNFVAKLEDADKKIDSVKFRVYKAENRIKKVAEAKADKKDQSAAAKNIDQVSNEVDQVNKEIDQVNKEIDALDELFAQKLTDLVTVIDAEKEELTRLRSEISAMLVSKVDQSALDERLEEDQIDRQKTMTLLKTELGVLQTDLDKRLSAFERKIDQFDELTRSLSTRLDKLNQRMNEASTQSPQSNHLPETTPSIGIVEKDLG